MCWNKGILQTDAEPMEICNTRVAVETALSKISGVQWVLTSISGEGQRNVGRRNAAPTTLHVGVVVGYTQTTATSTDFLHHVLYDAQLEVKEKSRWKKEEATDEFLQKAFEYAFKDHRTPCISTLISESNIFCINRAAEEAGENVIVASAEDVVASTKVCKTSVR